MENAKREVSGTYYGIVGLTGPRVTVSPHSKLRADRVRRNAAKERNGVQREVRIV